MAVEKPVLVVIDPTADADGFTTQLGAVDDYIEYGIQVVGGYVDTKAYFDEMLNDGNYLNDLQEYENRILAYYNDAYSLNETMVTDGILNNLSAKEMEELTIPLTNAVVFSEHHTQLLAYYDEFRGDKTNAEVYNEIKTYLTPLLQGISRILAESASTVFITGTQANADLEAWADVYKNILINEISANIDLGAKITTAQTLDTSLSDDIATGTALSDTLLTNIDEANTINTTIGTNISDAATNKDLLIAGNTSAQLTLNALNDAITNADLDNYVTKADITNDLNETLDTSKALSAIQGNVLKGYIDSINTLLSSDDVSLDSLQKIVDYIKINKSTLDALSIASIAGLQAALDNKISSLIDLGITATPTALNYTSNVTSDIQAQLDSKQPQSGYFPIASGAVNDGDVVVLNSDDTVSMVHGAQSFITQDTNVDTYLSEYTYKIIYIKSLDVVAFITQNKNRNTCYVYIGTIANNVITFGSGNAIHSGNVNIASLTWNETAGCLICAYDDYDDAVLYCRTGTISGTTVTFGTQVTAFSSKTYNIAMESSQSANTCVISCRSKAIPISVGGSTITVGTAADIPDSCYLHYNQVISKWVAVSIINNVDVTILDTDGSTITTNTTTSLTRSYTQTNSYEKTIFYDSTYDNYGVILVDENVNKVYIEFISTSTGTPTLVDTAYAFDGIASIPDISCSYDSTLNKLKVFTQDDTGNKYIMSVILKINNASITEDAVKAYIKSDDSYSIWDNNSFFIKDTLTVLFYENPSDYLTYMLAIPDYASTNSKYIGIAKDNATDGNSLEVATIGGIVNNQTGLITSETYYVDEDGTLTTFNTGVKIGKALSSTTLIITGDDNGSGLDAAKIDEMNAKINNGEW